MNILWWAGFSENSIKHVRSKSGTRVYLLNLSQAFLFLWSFLFLGVFLFFIMATHHIFTALIGAIVFGFVQWSVIRLTNASIRLAPHEFDHHLQLINAYEHHQLLWESMSIEDKEKTPKPQQPILHAPSFFKPSLFFVLLSCLSGVVWSMFLSTDHIVVVPPPSDEVIIQEVLRRAELTLHSIWMVVGLIVGLVIGMYPSILRWLNHSTLHEMYYNLAEYEHRLIVESNIRHKNILSKTLVLPLTISSYMDPPFNKRPKIMGWIDPQKYVLITVLEPQKETSVEDDTEMIESP
jgi:hypothetical protein